MYYVKEQYTLTYTERYLLIIFSEYLFGKEISNISLPYIEIDCSLESELIKENPWVESADGELFNRLKENCFDIEKMGCYMPERFSISLYDRAIAANARLLGVKEEKLRALVLIHMLAHYVTQCPKGVLRSLWAEEVKTLLALMEDIGCETKFIKMQFHIAAPDYFRKFFEGYLETRAQLLTCFSLRDNPEYLEFFTKISDVRSENYRRCREFADARLDDFVIAISLAWYADYINKLWPDLKPKLVIYEDLLPIFQKQ